jgi:hypothetical protein
VHQFHTFGCIVYVKTTKPFLSKLEDRGWQMIFVGYEQGTKAYRVYDPVTDHVHITLDVVFNEVGQWDWDKTETDEADSTFRVEYIVMSTRVPAEVPDADDGPRTSVASPEGVSGSPGGSPVNQAHDADEDRQISPPSTN